MSGIRTILLILVALAMCLGFMGPACAASEQFKGSIYAVGKLNPKDSKSKIKVGSKAPDFSLPSISGDTVKLSQFRGTKNVVLSFVPAAWTPVCSEQWPGYNIIKDVFDQHDAVLLGISVDNTPTLFAWTEQMGSVWFPVLSDFWPHGKVAAAYGVLRSSGTSERALFVIDKQGTIRYMDVHDINERPSIEVLIRELEKLAK
jgi:peroxiredoxin